MQIILLYEQEVESDVRRGLLYELLNMKGNKVVVPCAVRQNVVVLDG